MSGCVPKERARGLATIVRWLFRGFGLLTGFWWPHVSKRYPFVLPSLPPWTSYVAYAICAGLLTSPYPGTLACPSALREGETVKDLSPVDGAIGDILNSSPNNSLRLPGELWLALAT